jgi:hypothetical protein
MSKSIKEIVTEYNAKVADTVKEMEDKILDGIRHHISNLYDKNTEIGVSIEDGYVHIIDMIDGEQVNIFVYFNEPENIQIVKNESVQGVLEVDSDAYKKYIAIAQPFVDLYHSAFSWDGEDFLYLSKDNQIN